MDGDKWYEDVASELVCRKARQASRFEGEDGPADKGGCEMDSNGAIDEDEFVWYTLIPYAADDLQGGRRRNSGVSSAGLRQMVVSDCSLTIICVAACSPAIAAATGAAKWTPMNVAATRALVFWTLTSHRMTVDVSGGCMPAMPSGFVGVLGERQCHQVGEMLNK